MPICTKCGDNKSVETQPGQDNSTYVCKKCSDVTNIAAWKVELKELKAVKKPNESHKRRIESVNGFISSAEKE